MEVKALAAVACVLLVSVVSTNGSRCHVTDDTTNTQCLQGHDLIKELERYVNKELHTGYAYTHMRQYHERADKAYMGFAKLFKERAEKAQENAHELMEYFNKRGTTLKLEEVKDPKITTYQNLSHAVHKVIEHERHLNDALLRIHKTAGNDPHLQYFIEEQYLDQKVDIIRKMVDLRTNLDRLDGNHLGEHIIDQRLTEDKWF